MIEIVPAILPKSFEDLTAHVSRVRTLVSRVQIDIANGSYAPTETWPYTTNEHFDALATEDEGLPFWEDIDYELDMLVSEPLEALAVWTRVGISAAIVHIESTDDHQAVAEYANEHGIDLVWGIKPSTSVDLLISIIDGIGMPAGVQLMGNDEIGYHGVELDEQVYDKLRDLRERYPNLSLAVDIGVNEDTAPQLVEAGATKLVAGSAIFDAPDVREAMEKLSGS